MEKINAGGLINHLGKQVDRGHIRGNLRRDDEGFYLDNLATLVPCKLLNGGAGRYFLIGYDRMYLGDMEVLVIRSATGSYRSYWVDLR